MEMSWISREASLNSLKAPPIQLLAAPVAWQQNKRSNDNNKNDPNQYILKNAATGKCKHRGEKNLLKVEIDI